MIPIDIPIEMLTAANLATADVKNELAVQLYKQGRISLAQAKRFTDESAQLEEIFIKKEKSDQIDMDDFISWAAHDLRSPLNSIIGFTKVVLKGIDGPVTDLQVTDLTCAHVSGQRMLTLINNLIDMARLNNGEIKIEVCPGDMIQTLTDTANRWKKQNSEKEIQIEIYLSSAQFNFDSARIRQVTSGMLTYAANHVSEGGKVTLHASDDANNITIEIQSIGEKARDKFEMDLAMIGFICQGLIDLHGGSLNLGEDTGNGIRLSFTLPKA